MLYAIGYIVAGSLAVWFVYYYWNHCYKSPLARKVTTFSELVDGVEKDIDRAKTYIHIRVKFWDNDFYFDRKIFYALNSAVERGVKVVIRIDDDFIPNWGASENPFANLFAKWINEGKVFLYNQEDEDEEVIRPNTSNVFICIDGIRHWTEQRRITPQKRGLYYLYILQPSSEKEALPN